MAVVGNLRKIPAFPRAGTKRGNCLDLHKTMFFATGLWLNEHQTKQSNRNLFVLSRCTVAVACLITLSQLVDSTYNFPNMGLMTENLYLGIIFLMAIVKILTIMQKPAAINRLISRLESMKRDDRISMPEEKRLLRHHRLMARRLTIAFLVVCAFTSSGFSVIPVLDTATNATVRALPFRMWTPFDHTTTPSYEAMYVTVSVMAVFAGLGIGVFDTLFAAMMIATIGQLKILQYKLTNIRAIAIWKIEREREVRYRRKREERGLEKRSERLVNEKVTSPSKQVQVIVTPGTVLYHRVKPATYDRIVAGRSVEVTTPARKVKDADLLLGDRYKKKARKRRDLEMSEPLGYAHLDEEVNAHTQSFIGECVDHHIAILNFIDDLESVFWFVLVFQIMVSLGICVIVYQATRATSFNVKLIVMLMVTFAGITQLFMYCWYSSVITHESYNLNEAMYHNDWLHASPSFKRSMQIVLCRTEQCPQLKVAGFVPLSLTMFRRVLKQSYSMYSLITGLDSGVASAISDIGGI